MSTGSKPIGNVILPKIFNQLGILVLDGSGSMNEIGQGNAPKSKIVSSAIVELFNRLNASRVKQNFSFAYVKFDDEPSTVFEPIAFDFTTLMSEDFDPTTGKGGTTYICKALEKANEIADQFLANAPVDGVPHKVLILLMSDGMCFEPEITKNVANQIKLNPSKQIACAYFGKIGSNDTDAQDLLKEVASDATIFYTTIYEGEALRAFFERSISQSSGIKQTDLQGA
jgi:hypothetical protein